MKKENVTLSKDVIIINEFGLHARTSAQIAKTAQQARGPVWIIKDQEKVDATSIIDVLSLACAKGTQIKIQVDDEKDVQVLAEIETLVKTGFGE